MAAAGKRVLGTYVLVHGAWHGGWCWTRVAELLRTVGHTVFTPTLTGLGARAHLAHPGVDLALHVQDVIALLEAEELNRVVLVGHGYAGMVITGVAAKLATRLSQIVYLDAFVPAAGQAVTDLVPAERLGPLREKAVAEGDGWRVPPLAPERFGVTSARDTAWLSRHLAPQPMRTLEQPADAGPMPRLPRTYVYCSKPAMGPFDQFLALRDDRAWSYQELRTGHDPMVTSPAELTKLLIGVL